MLLDYGAQAIRIHLNDLKGGGVAASACFGYAESIASKIGSGLDSGRRTMDEQPLPKRLPPPTRVVVNHRSVPRRLWSVLGLDPTGTLLPTETVGRPCTRMCVI